MGSSDVSLVSGHRTDLQTAPATHRKVGEQDPPRAFMAGRVFPLRFDMSGGMLLSKPKGKRMSPRLGLPQGTLDLLILKTIAFEPQHGWAISERLRQISSATLEIRQGSLYPALHRLERRGWIKARWDVSDNNRRAKYYELTRKGRTELEVEIDAWRRLSIAVGHVLDTA